MNDNERRHLAYFSDPLLTAIVKRDARDIKARSPHELPRPDLAGQRSYLDHAVMNGALGFVKAEFGPEHHADLERLVICSIRRKGQASITSWMVNTALAAPKSGSERTIVAAVLHCVQFGALPTLKRIDIPSYLKLAGPDPHRGLFFTAQRRADNKQKAFWAAHLPAALLQKESEAWGRFSGELLGRDKAVSERVNLGAPFDDVLELFEERPDEANWFMLHHPSSTPLDESLGVMRNSRSASRGNRRSHRFDVTVHSLTLP